LRKAVGEKSEELEKTRARDIEVKEKGEKEPIAQGGGGGGGDNSPTKKRIMMS